MEPFKNFTIKRGYYCTFTPWGEGCLQVTLNNSRGKMIAFAYVNIAQAV